MLTVHTPTKTARLTHARSSLHLSLPCLILPISHDQLTHEEPFWCCNPPSLTPSDNYNTERLALGVRT